MAPRPFLRVRVGELHCVLPVEHVVEVLRPRPVQQVVGAPAWVLGAAPLRGQPTPVVRASSLLGQPERAGARWVRLRTGPRGVALEVDEVLGLVALDPDALALPPLLGRAEVISSLAVLDRELLHVLESSRIQTGPEGGEASHG